jgi:hypothetical protein
VPAAVNKQDIDLAVLFYPAAGGCSLIDRFKRPAVVYELPFLNIL